jgi:hypothetical protein
VARRNQPQPEDPQPVLERQRAAHQHGDPDCVDETGVAPLINNTGLDGEAPTG